VFSARGQEFSARGPRRRTRAADALVVLTLVPLALSQERATFTAEADLQSIAVEVTDRQGRDIRGLTAADFTLLEDGRPQKISFFGAGEQPISVTVLIDSSASMRSGNKLDRVRRILPPLLHGNLPTDEIYFAQFTDRVFPIKPLAGDERLRPPFRPVDRRAGTAFYDALRTAVCTLRTARNLRQAVVVITDGADQHSRLTLDELIRTAQASRPQIFIIGLFDAREADIFRNSGKVVTLVNSRDIDNPLKAFERISKETGAEAFFPANQRDLENAVTRILGILRAQYTLAYQTERPNEYRRIQVRVNRAGARVSARRAVGAEAADGGTAHFSAEGCEVSKAAHPYPWESHVIQTTGGLAMYRDDLSDPKSGWPMHQGLRYAGGGYEIPVASLAPQARSAGAGMMAESVEAGGRVPGEIAAYGPWFSDFRASVKIEPHPERNGEGDGGLIFRLNARGYYLLLLQRGKGASDTLVRDVDGRAIAYKLVKRFWDGPAEETIVPWTPFRPSPTETSFKPGPVSPWVTAAVECAGSHIAVRIDGIQAIDFTDDAFADGQIGMAFFGHGRALFRDLEVQGVQ
jgi:VWFA-related protein